MRYSTISLAVMGIVLAAAGNGATAEPVTPIGSLLVNPSAFHRKVLKLEGVAKNVAMYSGRETGTNQALCGADFELEDSSGKIGVVYHVRCQVGTVRAAVVTEGMPCVAEGYMEAPPTMMRTQDGKDLGFLVVAHTVTPLQ